MRSARYVALVLLAGLTFGSLLTTAGYAWYLRSDRYRNYCADTLSASLGLPSEIGRVVPRSRWAREFQEVRVWLPQRRGEAAFCRCAVLTYISDADDPEAYELELLGGRCEVSTRTWLREDYRFVLESGLRPGFDPEGPRRVVFSGMDLAFRRERFQAALRHASGVVRFADPHLAQATVTCREFNGHVASEPVTLQGAFSPQETGVRLDRVKLVVPELPLAIVGLDKLADLDLRSGSFRGQLLYCETADRRQLTASGKIFGLQLAECTAGLLTRPWRGSAPELELEELTLVNDDFGRLRFGSVLTGVVLGDVLAPVGLAAVGGRLTLYVRAADLSPAGIERFVASGRCDDISLESLSEALGWGGMTGTARIVIDDLTIQQNRVVSLDMEIAVDPPADESNWIQRELVSEVLRRVIGVPLPSFLPDRFEYTRLGVRLEVRDELLYVFGTHGQREKTILTVKVGEQELPVITEPADPFDLSSHLDQLRARLAEYVEPRWRALTPADAWRALSRPGRGDAPPDDPDRE